MFPARVIFGLPGEGDSLTFGVKIFLFFSLDAPPKNGGSISRVGGDGRRRF